MADDTEVTRFVIHEHYATNHHFDLRLEKEGSLWSWAVPKGMPTDPKVNRLAVRVEDHDLDHIDFVDQMPTPKGPAGAVLKSIWDSGTYEMIRETPTKLVLDLRGNRLQQRIALIRTGDTHWMVHLMATHRADRS